MSDFADNLRRLANEIDENRATLHKDAYTDGFNVGKECGVSEQKDHFSVSSAFLGALISIILYGAGLFITAIVSDTIRSAVDQRIAHSGPCLPTQCDLFNGRGTTK